MIFLRRKYKEKPKAWGPISAVQSAIFHNAERAGIDPGQFRFYYPCWEQAGQRINDYSRYQNHMPVTGAKWAKNQLYLDGTATGSVADVSLKPTGAHTLIIKYQYTALPGVHGALITFDAGSIPGYEINTDDLSTHSIGYKNRASVNLFYAGMPAHAIGVPLMLTGVYVPSVAGYFYYNR